MPSSRSSAARRIASSSVGDIVDVIAGTGDRFAPGAD